MTWTQRGLVLMLNGKSIWDEIHPEWVKNMLEAWDFNKAMGVSEFGDKGGKKQRGGRKREMLLQSYKNPFVYGQSTLEVHQKTHIHYISTYIIYLHCARMSCALWPGSVCEAWLSRGLISAWESL